MFSNRDSSEAIYEFRKARVREHDFSQSKVITVKGHFFCSRTLSTLRKDYRIIADPEGVEQVLRMYY